MKTREFTPQRLLNYGVAAVASVPLALIAPPVMAHATSGPRVTHTAAGASSESGRWLDSEWADMQRSLSKVLSNLPEINTRAIAWYETPGDTLYPTSSVVEILDVHVVDDDSGDAFQFGHVDFDAWHR